ncbi:RHS repeat-associated core domain-containing protein [Reichenbachiella sp.]|uniref:leucine-rich repeat domain-containing protein n=1 Tax=Reichenbachiella sp. TaxID=2184521 RepID=UPI0032993DED
MRNLYILSLVVSLLAIGKNSKAQSPSNDEKINAQELTQKNNWCSASGAYTTTAATGSLSGTCDGSIYKDVWFKFQAQTPFIDIGLTMVGLRYGTIVLQDAGGVEVGCKAGSSSGIVEYIGEALTVGDWYYVSIGSGRSSNSYNGTFTLCVNDQAPFDYKVGAVELTNLNSWCSTTNEYTTVGATGSSTMSCDGSNYDDVWFKFQAQTEFIAIDLTQGTIDYSRLALQDSQGNEIGCASSNYGYGTTISIVEESLVIGEWYYISVGDRSSASIYNGTFTLCVNDQIPFDYKAGAIELTNLNNWCSDTNAYTNVGATGSSIISCDGSNYDDVWFKFQAQTEFIAIDLTQGTIDYSRLVLQDSQGNEVGCASSNYSSGITISIVEESLIIGEWYYISVGDRSSATIYNGTFTLCVNDQAPFDYKVGAVELTSLNNWCSGTNEYSTENATGTLSASCDASMYNDVWFKFTAQSTDVDISMTPGTLGNAKLVLQDVQGSEIACKEAGNLSIVSTNLSIGAVYYLAVASNYSSGSDRGTFSLCIDNQNGDTPDYLEISALKDLYESTNGATDWTDKSGWPTSEAEWNTITNVNQTTGWKGVSVVAEDITGIDLPGNNLTGTLPTAIGDLKKLQYIYMNDNAVAGSIPASIGNLKALLYLILNGNSLDDQLPDELGDLESLKSLYLHDNLFSGTLPTTLGNLSNLQLLYIRGGTISGIIPSSFTNLTALRLLFIANCDIGGELPAFLGDLSELYYIYIGQTNVVGSIPDHWQNLNKLQHLYLFSNPGVTGNVPDWLGNLSGMVTIHLGNNSMIGSIPESLTNLSDLRYLYLHKNQLTGKIPENIGNLTNLENLYLSDNQLTGNIPASLGNASKLQYLYMQNNQLTGALPTSLSNLTSLKNFHAYGNNLSEDIGVDFNMMPSLVSMYLYDNKFSSIPNLSTHTNAANLNFKIENNNIPYADIENNLTGTNTHNFKTFTYSNQSNNTPTYPQEDLLEGTQLVIDTHDASTDNTYLWEKRNASGTTWTDVTAQNEHVTGDKYVKVITATESVIYRYTITNSVVNQTKVSNEMKIITINPKQVFLNQWTFQYKYDQRQRMTEKQVPGAGVVYMVYDNRDRLVLTQDANQREPSTGSGREWIFTKYDVLNRPVMTGIYIHTSSVDQVQMQAYVNNELATGNALWYESSGNIHGYNNASFPSVTNESNYLTVTYYDNYDFKNNWPAVYNYDFTQLTCQTTNDTYCFENTESLRVKGQVTGSKVKNLDDNTWLNSVSYYDDRYRVTQTITANQKGGFDRASNLYDFVGKVLQSKTVHDNGTQTYDILRTFDYDHAGRLLSVAHQINSDPAVTILANEYNELGELITKKLNKEGNDEFSQEINYQYNIRGWLTHINDPAVADATKYFAMALNYTDAANPQYNGNIGATHWKNPFEGNSNRYDYTYDPLNRLKSAAYTHGETNGMDYDVSNMDYDANGNILALERTGDQIVTAGANIPAQVIDDLSYEYSGNQLTKVTDVSGLDMGFKDGANTNEEYRYDANGNMISDANKGIANIEYNHLNLPSKVTKEDGQYIKYIYDAAGIKLTQEVYDGTSPDPTKVTNYTGEFIYENDTLQIIQHEEGRIVAVPEVPGPPEPVQGLGSGTQTFDYQYHLKDHLGNVRATFKTESDVESSEATFESAVAANETSYFSGYDGMRKITADLFNNTPGGNTSIRLNGSATEREGLGKSLMVKPGDQIDMEVYAKYYDPADVSGWTNVVNTAVVNSILANATGVVTPDAGGIGEAAFPFADWTGKDNPTGAPKAYLNYMVFDNNFKLIADQSGFKQISSAAKENGSDVDHEHLSHSITIQQAGYIYVYLSNEQDATASYDVFFDDFSVVQHHTPIVQKDDYYPFGLTFNNGYKRAAGKKNGFLYNGKELQDELDLGWMDYGARMYMPEIGRWNSVDKKVDAYASFSPYNYVLGNPIANTDINGEWTVTRHHNMTLNALSLAGIGGKQAEMIAHYTSVYADNPGKHLQINNMVHPLNQLSYKDNEGYLYSETANSQVTAWRGKGYNYNVWHSMRSPWEKKQYNARKGGISAQGAMTRGMRAGWNKVFESASRGKLSELKKNSVGIQQFGQGVHALQDAYAHEGISIEEHELFDSKTINDRTGDTSQAVEISTSAVMVHSIISGDSDTFNNMLKKGNNSLDLKGISGGNLMRLNSEIRKNGGKMQFNWDTGKYDIN